MPHRTDMSVWTGRVDAADGESGRRWHQVVRPVEAADGPGVVLLGFACDAGVRRNHGRPGAAEGPAALRRMLGNLAWHGGDDAEALPGVESVEQALQLLEDDRRLTLDCIEESDETEILGNRFTAPWGGSAISLFQHLLMMIAHLAQHKGQLFYYLKLMGKDVNTADLWGE